MLNVPVNSYGNVGWSVHLTTLFSLSSLTKLLTSNCAHTFACRFFAETLAAGRQEAAKTSARQEEGPPGGGAAEKRDVSRHCFGRLGFCGLGRFLTQTLAGGCRAAAGVSVSAARAGQAAAARALRR